MYSRIKVEAEDMDESMLIDTGQWTTMGMISKVRQALYCIQRHISSSDLEDIWTGCRFKQLAKLLKESGL